MHAPRDMPTSRYVNSDGREEYMSFKFERDGTSLKKALRLGLKVEPSAMNIDIPVFYAEGLQVRHPWACDATQAGREHL